MLKLVLANDEKEISQKAYEIMEQEINSKDDVTLGLATGSSPEGIYELFRTKKPKTNHVTTVNLDEYLGLEGTHPKSYRHFMNEKLFNHLPFKETFVPDGAHPISGEEAAKEYDAILNDHPVDLQLLGIGENGHIAFNEPGASFDAGTNVTDLTESTINANSRYFKTKDEVPTQAVTMGIASILKAKKILLIASGEKKAKAIKELIELAPTETMPATALKNHPDVTIVVDKKAASLLNEKQLKQYSKMSS
ncbi:MAG: glucosamine-6-phosphate deaminase [Turicibacter sp.]|nr:glucosamine-6-phosphate deaminase [Turicibacter sp.]